MKKIISLLIVFVMMLAIAPAVYAQEDSGILGFNTSWRYNSVTNKLTLNGRGEIRALHNGEKRPWHQYDNVIKTYEIGADITVVRSELLCNYPKLEKLIFHEGVTTLEMISGCDSLTSVQLPQTLTTVAKLAFYDCRSLKNIILPGRVSSINEYAFASSCFDNITVVESNQYFKSENGVLFNKDMTELLRCPLSKLNGVETLNVPTGVKRLYPYAYSNASSDDPTGSVKRIDCPQGLETIGAYAFYGYSSLETVVIPTSLTSIDAGAFGYCTKLSDVYFAGSQQQWDAINIGDENSFLKDATLHLGVVPPEQPEESELPQEIIEAQQTIVQKILAFFSRIALFIKSLLGL